MPLTSEDFERLRFSIEDLSRSFQGFAQGGGGRPGGTGGAAAGAGGAPPGPAGPGARPGASETAKAEEEARAARASAARALALQLSPFGPLGGVVASALNGYASGGGGAAALAAASGALSLGAQSLAAGGRGAAQGISGAPLFSGYGSLQREAAQGAERGRLGFLETLVAPFADAPGVGGFARDFLIGKKGLLDDQAAAAEIRDRTLGELRATFAPGVEQGGAAPDQRSVRELEGYFRKRAQRLVDLERQLVQAVDPTGDPSAAGRNNR